MTTSRTDQILDYAEREMRKTGFDAVSFRDIATAIGIKSASVHYHFPTKADLSTGVTMRYAKRFLDALGRADDPAETPSDRMVRLADAYIQAYTKDRSACLCAVLGAVTSHLPKETAQEIRGFFEELKGWVATALVGSDTTLTPNLMVGLLQGAMVLAIATQDDTPLFEAKDYVGSAV